MLDLVPWLRVRSAAAAGHRRQSLRHAGEHQRGWKMTASRPTCRCSTGQGGLASTARRSSLTCRSVMSTSAHRGRNSRGERAVSGPAPISQGCHRSLLGLPGVVRLHQQPYGSHDPPPLRPGISRTSSSLPRHQRLPAIRKRQAWVEHLFAEAKTRRSTKVPPVGHRKGEHGRPDDRRRPEPQAPPHIFRQRAGFRRCWLSSCPRSLHSGARLTRC
jgi:hypothetical protein